MAAGLSQSRQPTASRLVSQQQPVAKRQHRRRSPDVPRRRHRQALHLGMRRGTPAARVDLLLVVCSASFTQEPWNPGLTALHLTAPHA